MNYVVCKESDLEGKGYDYQFARRLPDGRIILELKCLKVISDFTPTIMSGAEIERLMKQKSAEKQTEASVEQTDINQQQTEVTDSEKGDDA